MAAGKKGLEGMVGGRKTREAAPGSRSETAVLTADGAEAEEAGPADAGYEG